MKTKFLILIAVCLIATLPLTGQETAEPEMAKHEMAAEMPGTITEAERAELVEVLEESRSELEALAAHATGDDWNWKPAEDRWSVGEVVEHLVLTEEGFQGMVAGSLEGGMDPEWQATLGGPGVSGIVAMMKDRSQKFQAPAEFVPTGEPSREELLGRFAALRAKSLDFVRSTHAPIKQHTAEGPAGKMNVHQWMAFCGAHNLRHNLQIKEVFQAMHHGDGDSDSESDSQDSESDSKG
ncbi:MAG: DinB family protein [Acidobacteriota bacterium]|nr:DinB family protein [Acidobacteriota bacterium]